MSAEAFAIRDAVLTRMKALAGFQLVRKVSQPQLQSGDLPAITVLVDRVSMAPDGDGNAGDLGFINDITIFIAVVRSFDDPEYTDALLDADSALIPAALFSDPEFTRMGPEALFESVERLDLRRVYPQQGDAYLGELRFEITFRVRTTFEPVIPVEYHRTRLTTRPLGHGAGTPAITTVIDQA